MIFLRASITALIFCLLASASAQRIKFQLSSTVIFQASQAELEDALSCTVCQAIQPLAGSNITLRAQRQGSQAYDVQVRQVGRAAFRLEARYTLSPRQSPSYTTDWLELSELSQSIYTGTAPVTDATVEYRLFLSPEDLAGLSEINLVYSMGSSSVSHAVQLISPAVVSLRLDTDLVGSSATVNFDYDGLSIEDYMTAVEKGTPLAISSSELKNVSIYTNNTSGAIVTLELFVIEEPEGGSLLNKLFLFDVPVIDQRFGVVGPTVDFVELFLAEDFSLHLDGSEPPGQYRYIVRYNASLNP